MSNQREIIHLTRLLTVRDVARLKDHQTLEVTHPAIPSLTLRIQKESTIMSVLNVPTVMYGKGFVIEDSSDSIRPRHEVTLDVESMVAYVRGLMETQNLTQYLYSRSLKEKGLQVGDIIELEDGKQGMVVRPTDESPERNIRFVPLKADGTVSKHKPRILYGGTTFRKVKEGERHA